MLSSSFHNISLSSFPSLIFLFLQFSPIQMQRPDGGLCFFFFVGFFFFFWHAQIKISLPLSLLGNSARFLNSLLSVCVITLLPVSSAADVEGWGFLTLKQPISSLYFILIGSIFLDRRKGCCHITVHWLFAQRRCPHVCPHGMKQSTDFFLCSLHCCVRTAHMHTYTCKYIGTEHNTLICWWQSIVCELLCACGQTRVRMTVFVGLQWHLHCRPVQLNSVVILMLLTKSGIIWLPSVIKSRLHPSFYLLCIVL